MMKTIGFLGCGNMGGAIARAVCKATEPENVFLANRTAAKAEALAIAEKLKSCQVKIAAKGGAGGKLFGAVTAKEISEQLKAQHGMELDSKKLVLAEPIKTFGAYTVKAKLGYEVSGTINVLVVEG